MNNHRAFDQLRVSELTILRHGWFRPWYELTDGQFTYGSLVYNGWLGRSTTIETAGNTWTVTAKGLFRPIFFINETLTGMVIGELKFDTWTRKIKVAIYNNIDAIFTTKKIFTRTFTLYNEQYGDILSIKQNVWKFKTPLTVTFDPLVQKKISNLPLLILLSTQLVLLRQQQAAAAH